MTKKEEKNRQIETAVKGLKSFGVKEGSYIYSYVRSVSPSGMSRQIKFFIVVDGVERGEIVDCTYAVATATQNRFNQDNRTLSISGCGMNMCFAVVYALGSVMFPNGSKTYITNRNGSKLPETDGGYCLKSVNLN